MQSVHSFMSAFNYNDEKLKLEDQSKRAELLDTNFMTYDREEIANEIKFINRLKPKLNNDGYHVALSFSEQDKLNKRQLISIANDYLNGMGFDREKNLFVLYKHNDGEDHSHIHIHLLVHRLSIEPQSGKISVVSDSNNYRRSENLCRELEKKYDIDRVRSSQEAPERAPNKDELEMIQRTGQLSNRMIMQEKVKLALKHSNSIEVLISNCGKQGVHLLFNQSKTTGTVSGITYIMDNGFMAKGQKLGNMYKWNNINKIIAYEQSTDSKAISGANNRTRAQFADLLSKRDERHQKRDNGTCTDTKRDYSESTSYSRSDQRTERGGDEPESNGNLSGAFGNEERISEHEGAHRHLLSNCVSALIGNFSSLSNSLSSGDLDEDEERKRRQRRRR